MTKKNNIDSKCINKKKVLFIGPYPPPYSGPEMSMKLFLDYSFDEKFNVLFLNTNVRKNNINKGRFDWSMIVAFFCFFFRLLGLLIRHRPAIAYYPVTATQIGWVGRDIWCLFLCHIFRVKTVIHLRGSHLQLNLATFTPIVQKIIRIVCRKVSCAIVQAECLRDQFSDLVPSERVRVLYQAIDTSEYENDDTDNFNYNQILFMGHLTHAKGYCDLVKAIPLVATHFPEVSFCFAGTLREGERGVFFNQFTGEPLQYEDPVKVHTEIMSDNFQKNYKMLGIISGNLKLETLKKTNIFVLPSYSEGFSRALLEAFAVGKPVVCTPVGAHKEIVEDGVNGFLVQPGDINGLANKIITILNDTTLRRSMATTNHTYARKAFTIKKIAFQLEEIFNDVIINQLD